jgi:hypothetical protein
MCGAGRGGPVTVQLDQVQHQVGTVGPVIRRSAGKSRSTGAHVLGDALYTNVGLE